MAPISRIVVVDDDPNIRNLLRAKLERDGDLKVVGEAGDGEEAIRLVDELEPDLVTMDIDMPRMDGLSAIRKIMPKRPVPIVVCTSLPAGLPLHQAMGSEQISRTSGQRIQAKSSSSSSP